jgi:hypothetical protein
MPTEFAEQFKRIGAALQLAYNIAKFLKINLQLS